MNAWPETKRWLNPDDGGGDGGGGGGGGKTDGDGGSVRKESKKHIVDQIYDQLNSLFHPGGDQIFCMEYPGRVLDIDSYKYDITSPYSVLAKPQLVTEAEFRLSDDLFDVAQITGGPNGRKFSTTYESVLNYLLPKLQDSQRTYIQDKAKMRAWLLEQVEYDETDETTGEVRTYKCSRMQLYQKLNDRYLKAKAAWEQEKFDRLRQAEASGNKQDLEEYSRWLASEAPVREAQLDALFSDLVVRGFYHEVRTELGYLDVKSPTEILSEAKASLRAASMSALDESGTVYPVQFQPADWFEALSTDFTPEDLTIDPFVYEQKLIAKENEKDALSAQLAALKAARTGVPEDLQTRINEAQRKIDSAKVELTQQYTSAAISAVEFALKYLPQLVNPATGTATMTDDQHKEVTDLLNKKGIDTAKLGLDKDTVKGILDREAVIMQNQLTLEANSRALAELQMQKAQADSTDTREAEVLLEQKISALQKEIDQLKAVISANVVDPKNDPDNKNRVNATKSLLPSGMPPAGRFMDVTISVSKGESSKESSLYSRSDFDTKSLSVWFGGYSKTSQSSESDFSSHFDISNYSIDIGFRATKVNIDRGWFHAELFNMTSGMCRLIDQPISLGPVDKSREGDPIAYAQDLKEKQEGAFFPAYPVSFVIAKDVTIKITSEDTISDEVKKAVQESSSSGGGFLCFSASSAHSSSQSSEAFYSYTSDNVILIKIPGPQILGWFLEFLPVDKSVKGYSSSIDMLPVLHNAGN